MGYRSDVRIVVSPKGYKELKEFLNDYLDGNDCENLLNYTDICLIQPNQVYLGWDWVKWYEYDDDGVDAIMEALNDLASIDLGYHYARIGEEYGDEEYRYHFGKQEGETNKDLNFIDMNRRFDDPIADSPERSKKIEGIKDVILSEDASLLEEILSNMNDKQLDRICRKWHIGYDEDGNPED